MLSRRNALTILGLGTAGIAVEDGFADEDGRLKISNNAKPQKIAAALRKLADEIEGGGVDVVNLHVASSLERDQLVTQKLSCEFIINDKT
jgi:hypothetical protein